MAMNAKSGAHSVRRALRRSLRGEMPSVTVSAGQVDVHQIFFVNASPGAMEIRAVYVAVEAVDNGETALLTKFASGTAIESGTPVLIDATSGTVTATNPDIDTGGLFNLETNVADVIYKCPLSTSAKYLAPGEALGVVLSAGTDTANFCLTVDLIPA